MKPWRLSQLKRLRCPHDRKPRALVIHVRGEAASVALCDCLRGWTCKRASRSWWHITTTASPQDVEALARDLGITAIVKEA